MATSLPVSNEERYAFKCMRYFLGLTKAKLEPLGKNDGLSFDQAERICDTVYRICHRAGVAKKDRHKPSASQAKRLRTLYEQAGL